MTRQVSARGSADSAIRPPAKNEPLPRSSLRLCRKAADDSIDIAAVVPRVCVGLVVALVLVCTELVVVAVDVELVHNFWVAL
jgi:hypothetical protein